MEIYHSAIHQNLILFTKMFSNLDMEGKLQKGMFKKPNTKGMQSIFHSLILIINPDYCRKCVPWPISFASDSYKFRSAVIDFIKKECCDFELPKLLPSLLNKADGEKYVRFVFNFSTYVTKIVVLKKYGELLCEKPNISVNFDGNASLLDAIIVVLLRESKNRQRQYNQFKENSSKWIKLSEVSLCVTLKEYHSRKQTLLTELEEITHQTLVAEDSAIEHFIIDFEREMLQFKRRHDKLQTDVLRILNKQDYLIYLINLKNKIAVQTFEMNAMAGLITNHDTFAAIHVPIGIMPTKVITSKTAVMTRNYGICFKYFLRYARIMIATHVRRFLELNLSSKHLEICCTASDISTSSTERVNRFEKLIIKLLHVVAAIRKEQFIVKPGTGDWSVGHYIDVTNVVKLQENYDSRFDLSIVTRNVLPGGFFAEAEPARNSSEKIKQKIQSALLVWSTERTAKLYQN